MRRFQRSIQARRGESGFTLIELLVVIVILGILAAVVVFAVSGVGDKGKASAITIDQRTLRTAEEAYCAKNGRYADGATLIAGGFLSDQPQYHQVFAQQGGGNCNGWRYSILRTAQAGAYPQGTWATTDPPPANLVPVFTARLTDGRVLVGGCDSSDPSAGTAMTAVWSPNEVPAWTVVDPHPEPGCNQTTDSTLLLTDDPSTPANECASETVNNCGKVLVREGFLFDPTRAGVSAGQPQWETLPTPADCDICGGAFSYAPRNMVQIKGLPSVCGTLCGWVLMTGSAAAYTSPLDGLLYQPSTNTYTKLVYNVDENTVLYNTYMNQLPDGRVFTCCLGDYNSVTPGSLFFDPLTLEFTSGPPAPTLYYRITRAGTDKGSGPGTGPAPVLPNGDLFFTSDLFGSPDAGIYEPQLGGPGSWRPTVPACPTSGRCNILASLLDGRILARDDDNLSTYVYNPVTQAWDSAGQLIDSSAGGSTVVLDPTGGPCGSFCGKVFVPGPGVAQLYTP